MQKSGATFDFNESAVLSQIDRKIERARLLLADRVKDDSNIFIPVDTGLLRSTGRVEDGGHAVTWNTEYATFVYYPERRDGRVITIHTDKNPNATHHWFEVAKNLKVDEWLRVVEMVIK